MPIRTNLVFLHNELANPVTQRLLHLPLTFVGFGIVEARMYTSYGNKSNFIINDTRKAWGNNVVYGGIFLLNDFDFYISILDAYHICSMSTLRVNHLRDTHHRHVIKSVPIRFDNLDSLARLTYTEHEPLDVHVYLGNLKHPKINQRLHSTRSLRIADGIDKTNFKQLYREVTHGRL